MNYKKQLVYLAVMTVTLHGAYTPAAAALSSSSSKEQAPLALQKQDMLNTVLYRLCCRIAPFATMEEAAQLLKQGAEINKTEEGSTLLHEAATRENVFLTKYLLEQGAHITLYKGATLLSLCSNPAITELLLAAGADAKSSSWLFSELESAIMAHQSPKKIIQLLSYGAPLNNQNTHSTFKNGSDNPFYNHTPLDVALKVLRDHITYINREEISIPEIEKKLRNNSLGSLDREYLQNLLNKLNDTISTIKVLVCNGAHSTHMALRYAESLGDSNQESEVTDLMFNPQDLLNVQGETISRVSLYAKGGTVILDPISPTLSPTSMAEQLGARNEFFLTIAQVCRYLVETRRQNTGMYAAAHASPSDAQEGKEVKKQP